MTATFTASSVPLGSVFSLHFGDQWPSGRSGVLAGGQVHFLELQCCALGPAFVQQRHLWSWVWGTVLAAAAGLTFWCEVPWDHWGSFLGPRLGVVTSLVK